MRTQLEELFGGGLALDVAAGTSINLPLPYGQGGARHLLIDVFGGATPAVVTLPNTTWMRAGGRRQYTLVPFIGKIDVRDSLGTSYGVFDAALNEVAWIYLADRSTLNGTWIVRKKTTAFRGSAISATRELFTLTLDTTDLDGFDLREWANSAGFSGRNPAGIRCTIKAGVVIGSETTSEFAFRTGVFPTGSTLFLNIESGGHIAGRGGNGGRGQAGILIPGGLPAQAGFPGGDALRVEMNTWLMNSGRISGGGGGGGGGPQVASIGGGGGGGGAGYIASLGGPGGQGGGVAGQPGSLEIGGQGGFSGGAGAGGNGSLAGQVGSPGGGVSGGAAGRAIVRVSAYSLVKIRAGTIEGAEVVV